MGHKVVALEKVIAASERKRKAEEIELEIVAKKLERIDRWGRELTEDIEVKTEEMGQVREDVKRLKSKEQKLMKERDEKIGKFVEYSEEKEATEVTKSEVEERISKTVKVLEEQKGELRAVHGEGLARAGGGGSRLFLAMLVARKARDLECPVCLTEAAPPILGCRQFHLLCSACAVLPEVASCPTCRSAPADLHQLTCTS